METCKTTVICKLNDDLRRHYRGGQIMLTQGVLAQGESIVREVVQLMRSFDSFSPANDPYGEHDFGSIVHNGQKYFWKIDYYDLACSMHSEDPANPAVTRRVLTVMLVEEY